MTEMLDQGQLMQKMRYLQTRATRLLEANRDDPDLQQEQMKETLRTLAEAGIGVLVRRPPPLEPVSLFCQEVFAPDTALAQEVQHLSQVHLTNALRAGSVLEMVQALTPNYPLRD